MAYKVGQTVVIEDDRDVINVGNVTAAGRIYAGGGLFENPNTITSSYTITAGRNAMSSGPITIAPGFTITVSDGARWVIV